MLVGFHVRVDNSVQFEHYNLQIVIQRVLLFGVQMRESSACILVYQSVQHEERELVECYAQGLQSTVLT
jgi:hypothetical protein